MPTSSQSTLLDGFFLINKLDHLQKTSIKDSWNSVSHQQKYVSGLKPHINANNKYVSWRTAKPTYMVVWRSFKTLLQDFHWCHKTQWLHHSSPL